MQNIMHWIPVDSEQKPPTEGYILLSFSNYPGLCIGRYEEDEDGGGSFYDGDQEDPLTKYGLFVNAWMPCPPRYED